MKNILVPTDFSELADYAYDLACFLMNKSQSQIHAVKIVEAPGDTLFDHEGNLLNCSEYDISPLKQEAERAKADMKAWLKNKKGQNRGVVQIGHLTTSIPDYAEKNDIELIVMGTRSVTGLRELTRGSHAEKIIRDANVPVLTLKCDRSHMKIDNILLPSSFKNQGKQNLEAVKKIQSHFGATIHLLKVITENDFSTNQEAMKQMNTFAKMNDLQQVTSSVYCDESIEEGIVHYAQEKGMDLIAIGTHGRSGIQHWFKGDATQDIVNHVYMPILTYKI